MDCLVGLLVGSLVGCRVGWLVGYCSCRQLTGLLLNALNVPNTTVIVDTGFGGMVVVFYIISLNTWLDDAPIDGHTLLIDTSAIIPWSLC